MDFVILFIGLPEDVTNEEMKEFFGKAGIFRIDPLTGKEKIKIYQDDEKHCKGDGLVSYAKEESQLIIILIIINRC